MLRLFDRDFPLTEGDKGGGNTDAMKKSTLYTCLAICTFSLHAFAGSADLFRLNENFINDQLSGLTRLENFVNHHEGFSLSQLNSINSSEAKNITGEVFIPNDRPPLGIPAFVWGLCLNLVGVAIVYLATDDPYLGEQAFYGCAASVGVMILFYWSLVQFIFSGIH